jgi:hypothetical protein
MALKLFWVFGIGAFMIPVLLLMFGLGYLFQFLSYLQRRWLWGGVLLLCCMCLASMFEERTSAGWWSICSKALNAPSVGGYIGQFFNNTSCITWAKWAPPSCWGGLSHQPHLPDQFQTRPMVPPMVGRRLRAAHARRKLRRERSGTPRARLGEAGPQIAGATG